MLTVADAERIVLRDVFENDGTYTLLRLGEDPGPHRIAELRSALHVLWRHFNSSEQLPRQVVYACAVIIQFRDECLANRQAETLSEDTIRGVSQSAFELLAGQAAEAWVPKTMDS